MAKKLFEAKALVNITHNMESFKIGDTLKLNADEVKELLSKGYIENNDKLPTEDSQENEDGKSGE